MPSFGCRPVAALSIFCLLTASAAAPAAETDFFESKIRPVLVKHCYECHSAAEGESQGGLTLDTREGIRRGGDRGPAVVPDDAEQSLLMTALGYQQEDLQMPPDGRLPDDVLADFRKWIATGAPDPRGEPMPKQTGPVAAEADELWSLAPLADAPPPATAADWPRSDIDCFVQARREQAGLAPVADAEPHRLVRRIHYDLLGLPPSAEAAKTWSRRLGNADPVDESVWAELVDSLLASPQFGQRWGRHWLDVARYAESNGQSRDVLYPYAWRYRDWVVDAFNADLPLREFMLHQIAGDLLPADDPGQRQRQRIATGLLAIGSKPLSGGNLQAAIADDQIDVVTRGFMAMTAACARCHDHKFDPIPQADYYALAGIFNSTQTFYGGGTRRPRSPAEAAKVWMTLGEDAPRQVKQLAELQKDEARLKKQAAAQRKRLQKLRAADKKSGNARPATAKAREALQAAEAELKRIAARRGGLDLKFAMGVADKDKPADSPLLIRGEPKQRGDVVARGGLSCVPAPMPEIDEGASGRLELARWIADPANPLTWRAAANRVWHRLFGRGLVATVDNFGSTGERPTHPLLLDHLARRLLESGSRKQLIREIVLSRTYRLSTRLDEQAYAEDADNRLLWRARRRRLEVECIRDGMLAAAGRLDVTPRDRSAVAEVGEGEVGRNINQKPLQAPYYGRTLYLPVLRTALDRMLGAFDFPDPSNLQGRRDVTNVPLQSLHLMNGELAWEMAESLGERCRRAPAGERLEQAYWSCFARPCSPQERRRGEQFLAAWEGPPQQAWTALCHALLASAEFRYLD